MHDAIAGLMAAPISALAAVLAGALLGVLFYAGLWWTVSRVARFTRPGLSVMASLLVRMGAALGGFYVVADGQWARLLLCLLGFVLSRATVTWLTRLPASPPKLLRAAPGTRHAP
jgi:F1F0 ATPase subunit 2